MENDNSPRFCVVTRYTEEAYRALAYLMLRKLRRGPRLLVLLTGFASIAGAVACMMVSNAVSVPAILVLMLGNLLCMFGLFAERFCVRMMMAGNKRGAEPQMEYRFGDSVLSVQTGAECREYAYASIRRALEMSGYLFFFMDDGQLYLLRLDDIEGCGQALRAFLETRIAQARTAKG